MPRRQRFDEKGYQKWVSTAELYGSRPNLERDAKSAGVDLRKYYSKKGADADSSEVDVLIRNASLKKRPKATDNP